ncbi:MAG TPA: hypothetical protein VL069_16500, partial [Opitutus sp.]|nr:hypothetical protein [Opitutus sp.]
DAPDATTFGPPVERRASGRDVYVYFDNDVKTHAPFDAMKLTHLLALGPPAPSRPVMSPRPVEAVRTSWSAWKTNHRPAVTVAKPVRRAKKKTNEANNP